MDAMLTAGEPVTVILRKHGRADVRYPATALDDDGTRAAVRAPWAGPPVRDFGFVRFEHGDVFTEHYWRDRWYAVKEVRAADGRRKGWYCDMARPACVRDGELTSVDLELDLWVPADGSAALRLDEDEFLASGLPETDPEAAGQARQALDELAARARAGTFTELTAVP
ncbi:DUF402 domain-containing protein [Streptomyces oceani]|uniref:RNA-binding protein n=1 Tax=Streptomyces oceani TaxID=1075402 RepID=A0A1E7KQH5_9ACTN|nr:DUF402 domain-containing protein [Streptomyces oceani]OEV04186.1 RNA-binding protein [Streptomyces oceani]OEV06199.1 RNA-binding protein [Streptomyces oceani]